MVARRQYESIVSALGVFILIPLLTCCVQELLGNRSIKKDINIADNEGKTGS